MDEFARLQLLQKYPRYSEYLTDDLSYYPDFEPESLSVAEVNRQVVRAVLGGMDTRRFEQIYQRQIRKRLLLRLMTDVYGWPDWLPAIVYRMGRTESDCA